MLSPFNCYPTIAIQSHLATQAPLETFLQTSDDLPEIGNQSLEHPAGIVAYSGSDHCLWSVHFHCGAVSTLEDLWPASLSGVQICQTPETTLYTLPDPYALPHWNGLWSTRPTVSCQTSLGARSLASDFSRDEKILELSFGGLLLFSCRHLLFELCPARRCLNLHIRLVR